MIRAAMRHTPNHLLIVFVMAAALGLSPTPLHATSLSLDTCLALWRQNNNDQTSEVLSLMAQGAIGAKERLSSTQLNSIKTYIANVEQLKFRCRQFVPPPPGAISVP